MAAGRTVVEYFGILDNRGVGGFRSGGSCAGGDEILCIF